MSEKYPLQETLSPIDKKGRDRLNENWTRIMAYFDHVQLQIKALAGGHEVDELIARLEQAIANAETDLQNYIAQVDTTVQEAINANNTATQDAINANNQAVQTALNTIGDVLTEVSGAIQATETATNNAVEAKDEALQAAADAQTTISQMQVIISNFTARGEWNATTDYFKNNLAGLNGKTYIALQNNTNKPVTDTSFWMLFADRGAKGEKGEKGDPGTGIKVLGHFNDASELPLNPILGDAYTIGADRVLYVYNGNDWQDLGSIKGVEGKSAYEVAVENGFVGTEIEWLESLKGGVGPPGPEGPRGLPGKDADLTEVNQEIANIKQTVTDNKTEVTEHLGQLEQTTENHIIDSTKHLLDGERNKINNALQPSTYNASNTIVNIGANRATRVFPQINWAASGIELWEVSFSLPKSVWGILELDIAGFSAMAGAKIVIELGVNVPASGESTLYKNMLKVVTATTEFTENFYVEVEHRASVKGIYIKVFKRTHNDPLNVTATFTSVSNSSTLSAFDFLKGFSNGSLFTNIASVPTTRQKDFDTRIKENFTSFSSFKTKISSATTDMGVPTNADATGDQMAANIRAISKGVKSASGYISVPAIAPNGTTTVQTPVLDFEPKNSSFGLPGAQLVQGSAYNLETAIANWKYVTKVDIMPSGSKWIVQFTVKNGYPTTSATESFRYNITN